MKRFVNRITAIVLAAVLLLPMLTVTGVAAEETVYVVNEDFESYAIGDTVQATGGFHSTIANGNYTVAADPAGGDGKVMHFLAEHLIETWSCRINASFNYATDPKMVISYDLYVPAATTGSMQVNAHTSSGYIDVCEIFFKEAGKDGSVGAKNANVSFTGRTSFTRDAWHTLTWTLTLSTGEITMLIDDTVAFIATLKNKTNMTFNYLAFARTYAGSAGDLYVDNLRVFAGEENGIKVRQDMEEYSVGDTLKATAGFHTNIAGGKFTVAADPAGTSGKAMHFKAENLIETWDCRINAAFSYATTPKIVFAYDLYVPAATTGSMQVNAHTSSGYIDVCEIFFKEAGKDGSVGAKNANVSFTGRTSFTRDAWHTLTWTLTLSTGEITMLIDDTVAFIATLKNKTNMTFNYLAFARTYAGSAGDLYADNFLVYAGEDHGRYLVRVDLEEYAAGDVVSAKGGLGYRADGSFGKGLVSAMADPEDPSNTVMRIPTGDLIENWNVGTATFPTSATSYEREPALVMEHRIYIPAETTGGLQLNSRRSYPSGRWFDLYEIDYSVAGKDATVRLKDASPTPSFIGERKLKREQWYTLTLSVDQVTGAYTLLIDGNVALEGKFSPAPTNLECYYFLRPYAGSVGDIYVDDVCIYRGYEKGTYATPKYLVNADMEHYDYGETINYGGGHTGLTNSIYDANYLIAVEDPKNPSNRVMQVQADRSNDISNNNTYEPLMSPAADSYLTMPRLVLEHDIYLPSATTGSMQVNAWRKYAYTDAVNESTKFYDLYEIHFGTAGEDATLSLKGAASATYDGGVRLSRDAWHTLTYSVDQATGEFILLVDGAIAYCGTIGATKLNIATYYFGTTYADASHPTRTGFYYVDNVHIYEGWVDGQVLENFESGGAVIPTPDGSELVDENGNTYLSLPIEPSSVGNGVILAGAPYTYETDALVLLQARVRIDKDSTGKVVGRLGETPIYSVDLTRGCVTLPSNENVSLALASGEWHTLSLVLSPETGAYDLYVDGIGAFSSAVSAKLSLNTGNEWTVALLTESDAYAGALSLDDISVRPFDVSERSEIATDAGKIFNYVNVTVNGETVQSGVPSVLLPEHAFTAAEPVYFDAASYIGMLETLSVSSLRLKEKSGLRFATRIDVARFEELRSRCGDTIADVTLSTLIAPVSYVTKANGQFTKQALDALVTSSGVNYLDIRADAFISEGVVDNDPETVHFVGSIVNILEENYARAFAGIGYVEITLRSGEVITLYSDTYHQTTVQTMARLLIQNHTDYYNSLGKTHKTLVKAFAALPEESENATQAEFFTFTPITTGQNAGTYSVRAAEGKSLPARTVIPSTYRSCAVSVIETDAFAGQEGLISITLPAGLCEIGDGAFTDCTRLFEVVNNSTLKIAIGRSAHGGVATYAQSVFMGESRLIESDGYLFGSVDGTAYLLGYVGEECELTLPDTYASGTYNVYKDAFSGRDNIRSVTFGAGVREIGKNAFRDCTELSVLVLPDAVTAIGDGAFAGCTGLVGVTLGASLSEIGEDAFLGCYKLTEVINRSALPIAEGESTYGFVAANALAVHTGESLLVTDGDFLFYSEGETNYLLAYLGNETTVTLPAAFAGAQYQLRAYALYGKEQIASIVLGAGVNAIGVSALDGCDALTEIYYQGSTDGFASISVADGNGVLDSVSVYFYSEARPETAGNYWYDNGGIPTVW